METQSCLHKGRRTGANLVGAARTRGSTRSTKVDFVGYELNGMSTPWFGIQWKKTEGDKGVARRVIIFLEDRRLLFGGRHGNDEQHCLESAQQIRRFLTQQMERAKPGKELEASLRAMRAASSRFVEQGGPYARNFRYEPGNPDAFFFMALGELRAAIGYQLGLILSQYPQPIDPQLESILPPPDASHSQDLTWLPGFEQ